MTTSENPSRAPSPGGSIASDFTTRKLLSPRLSSPPAIFRVTTLCSVVTLPAMSAFRPTTRIVNFSRNLVRNQAFRQTSQRRFQSTAAEANGAPQSGFAKFWNSPVGPKTVHFWCVSLSPCFHRVRCSNKPTKKISLVSRAIMLGSGDTTQTT